MIEQSQIQEALADLMDDIEPEWRCDRDDYKLARRAISRALDSLISWVEAPDPEPDTPPVHKRPFER